MDPITLSVLSSALSGIAEEMGTVLVRSASSSTSRSGATARRRSSTRTAHGRPGRAHPRAPGRDAGVGRRRDGPRPEPRRFPFAVNDPFSGGNHLPDITLVHPGHRGRDRQVRGHPRPPLRRRRDAARLDAERLARHLLRGPGHPTGAPGRRRRAGRRRARPDLRQHPHARAAPWRLPRPDRRQRAGRRPPDRADRAARARARARRLRRGRRLHRAAHPRPSPRCPTASTAPRARSRATA